MTKSDTDQYGREWDIAWGLSEHEALSRFGDFKEFNSAGQTITLKDPQWRNETKRLDVYEAGPSHAKRLVAFGEITPGVYAAGVLK